MQGVEQRCNLGLIIEAPAGVVRGGQKGFRIRQCVRGSAVEAVVVAVLKGRIQELGQLLGFGRQPCQAGAVAGDDVLVAQDALWPQHP